VRILPCRRMEKERREYGHPAHGQRAGAPLSQVSFSSHHLHHHHRTTFTLQRATNMPCTKIEKVKWWGACRSCQRRWAQGSAPHNANLGAHLKCEQCALDHHTERGTTCPPMGIRSTLRTSQYHSLPPREQIAGASVVVGAQDQGAEVSEGDKSRLTGDERRAVTVVAGGTRGQHTPVNSMYVLVSSRLGDPGCARKSGTTPSSSNHAGRELTKLSAILGAVCESEWRVEAE
jgi:hypothetical protein